VTKRSRIVAFGSAGLLLVAGALCAAVVGGETGEVLAMVLIGLGLVAATSLVFLEVGLSEDRERARERKAQRPAGDGRAPRQGASGRPARRRLERSRGERRRLK
jgi:hypothetical protein